MTGKEAGKKMFGVALDPSDDPWSLELKQAWINSEKAEMEGLAACRDPYEAVTCYLGETLKKQGIEPAGKFPVPSWLTPRPNQDDLSLINAQHIGIFYDSGELISLVRRLQEFVENEIFPASPVMVGVDHTATMGVLAALSRKYGADNISVITLDQHFDAIPMSVRVAETSGMIPNPMGGMPLAAPASLQGLKEHCCCGNFWEYILNEGYILPQNLSFIGSADYPGRLADSAVSPFRDCYLSFEKKGCRFFPLYRFNEQYIEPLTAFISEGIRTSKVYVSLDLDVGAYNFSWAARYMDVPGISLKNLLDTANRIRSVCQSQGAELVGFDIMEFNMHFLGIEPEDGTRDTTMETVGEYLKALTG